MSTTVPKALSDDEIGVLTDGLADRPAWIEFARALETAANERASDGLRLLSLGFLYDLVPHSHEDRRKTTGGPYASMF